MGQRRQRLASTPLAGSTQSAGHTIESGSRSAGPELACRGGGSGRGGAHKREKEPPPTLNDFKLFCWMTDFISDRNGREKGEDGTEGGREGGVSGFVVGKPEGGREAAVVVATGENTVLANVMPDGSDEYHKTTFTIDKRHSELLK